MKKILLLLNITANETNLMDYKDKIIENDSKLDKTISDTSTLDKTTILSEDNLINYENETYQLLPDFNKEIIENIDNILGNKTLQDFSSNLNLINKRIVFENINRFNLINFSQFNLPTNTCDFIKNMNLEFNSPTDMGFLIKNVFNLMYFPHFDSYTNISTYLDNINVEFNSLTDIDSVIKKTHGQNIHGKKEINHCTSSINVTYMINKINIDNSKEYTKEELKFIIDVLNYLEEAYVKDEEDTINLTNRLFNKDNFNILMEDIFIKNNKELHKIKLTLEILFMKNNLKEELGIIKDIKTNLVYDEKNLLIISNLFREIKKYYPNNKKQDMINVLSIILQKKIFENIVVNKLDILYIIDEIVKISKTLSEKIINEFDKKNFELINDVIISLNQIKFNNKNWSQKILYNNMEEIFNNCYFNLNNLTEKEDLISESNFKLSKLFTNQSQFMFIYDLIFNFHTHIFHKKLKETKYIFCRMIHKKLNKKELGLMYHIINFSEFNQSIENSKYIINKLLNKRFRLEYIEILDKLLDKIKVNKFHINKKFNAYIFHKILNTKENEDKKFLKNILKNIEYIPEKNISKELIHKKILEIIKPIKNNIYILDEVKKIENIPKNPRNNKLVNKNLLKIINLIKDNIFILDETKKIETNIIEELNSKNLLEIINLIQDNISMLSKTKKIENIPEKIRIEIITHKTLLEIKKSIQGNISILEKIEKVKNIPKKPINKEVVYKNLLPMKSNISILDKTKKLNKLCF